MNRVTESDVNFGETGINTAIYSPSGANTGIGFAVPVDVVRSSVSQIIKYGRVVRPIMGIAFAPDQSVEQVCPVQSIYVFKLDSDLPGVGKCWI